MTFSLNLSQNHTLPRTFAYLRMSTPKQNLEKNKSEILMFAHSKKFGSVEFVEEYCSGKVDWRQRKIGQILETAQPGDRVIFSEFSRMARSMLQCLEIMSVAMQKQVCLYTIKGGWELDNSLQSKVLAFAFSLCSEVERDLISARTVEALRVKKEQGVVLGRPKGKVGKSKLDQYRPEIEGLLSNGATQTFISRRYDSTPANLCLWMKKHQIKKPYSQNKELHS
jgi:DNA invertase Pin-like site-specific DNA recombinase